MNTKNSCWGSKDGHGYMQAQTNTANGATVPVVFTRPDDILLADDTPSRLFTTLFCVRCGATKYICVVDRRDDSEYESKVIDIADVKGPNSGH